MTQEQFSEIVLKSFCADTSKSGYKWSPENPTVGQCAVCALLAQDYFGGEIAKIKVKSFTHYFNIINNEITDFTAQQFLPTIPNYNNYTICNRKNMLKVFDTKRRYELLKQLFKEIANQEE